MIPAKLLHNPKAGDKEHSKEELLELLADAGYECRYSSTKETGWDVIEPDTELLIIAGGDGTVRKVARKLLQRKLLDKQVPLAVLALGTANNIAKSLNIPLSPKDAIQAWNTENIKPFDAGKVEGIDGLHFFAESFGAGLLPSLINKMQELDGEPPATPEESIRLALKVMYDLVISYEAHKISITADGVDYSGKYLLVEVMNTPSIGANLVLAPNASPFDGTLDLVLLSDAERNTFAEYLLQRINGEDVHFECKTISAEKITMKVAGLYVHTDDEILKVKKKTEVNVEILKSVFQVYTGPE